VQDFPQKPYTFDPVRAAELLSLIANPVRIDVLRRVLEREWDVTALALDLGITQSALSQHLAKLRVGGLARTRRSAQQILYSSTSDDVMAIFRALDAFGPMPTGDMSEAQLAKRLPRIKRSTT
jgi:ArsR family transcriptional regulator, virulence genes transcriptional regulator